MQNDKYVYLLTLKQAMVIAAKNDDDENWDIWDITAGCQENVSWEKN